MLPLVLLVRLLEVSDPVGYSFVELIVDSDKDVVSYDSVLEVGYSTVLLDIDPGSDNSLLVTVTVE